MAVSNPNPPAARAERQAVTLALAAILLWSTVATGFKLGLETMRPLQLLALGSVISLGFFVLAYFRARPPPAPRRALWQAAALGLINPFAYYLVLFEAYDRLPAHVAQPLNYTWAVTLAILAAPVLGQRLSRRTCAGIAVSYFGAAVVATRGELTTLGSLSASGIVLVFASTLLWAGYWLTATRLALHPTQLLMTAFSVGAPCVVGLCLLTDGLPDFTVANLGFGLWVGLVEMGVAFLLWQRALFLTRHAGRLSQLIFLSPFLSLAIIAGVLGEAIHISALAGLSLIVLGLAVRGPAPA